MGDCNTGGYGSPGLCQYDFFTDACSQGIPFSEIEAAWAVFAASLDYGDLPSASWVRGRCPYTPISVTPPITSTQDTDVVVSDVITTTTQPTINNIFAQYKLQIVAGLAVLVIGWFLFERLNVRK